MTEHEHEHEHEHESATTLRSAKDNPEVAAVFDPIKDLDTECRYLLADSVMHWVRHTLNTALTEIDHGHGANAISAVILAQNALNLAGFALAVESDSHPDWTRVEDSRVNAVWDRFTETLRAQAKNVLTTADIPADVAERLGKGEGTPEDFAKVREILEARGVPVPEDVDIEVVSNHLAAPEEDKDETPPPSTGMYL